MVGTESKYQSDEDGLVICSYEVRLAAFLQDGLKTEVLRPSASQDRTQVHEKGEHAHCPHSQGQAFETYLIDAFIA